MKRPITIKKAVIPAAGAGARMGYLGKILPKCMYPIASKPIIHHVIDNARLLGVEEVVLITHFKEQMIHDYFDNILVPELKISARYVHQENLSGLADAIALGSDHIDEPFVVILGDDFTMATDFDNLLECFAQHPEAVVVEGIVKEQDRQHLMSTCCVEREPSGRMLRIEEKPREPFSDYRGTGFYLFRPEVFDYIEKTPVSSVRNEREITDTIGRLAEEGRAYAEIIRGINMNINCFDDLLHAWNTHNRLQSFLQAIHVDEDSA